MRAGAGLLFYSFSIDNPFMEKDMHTSRFASRSLTRPLLLAVLAGACALPLLPAHALGGDNDVTISRTMTVRDGGEPFALVRDGGNVITGNDADQKRVKELKRSVKGDFLWFRDGGKEYIVQDPAALQRMDAAWAPMKELGAQMGQHGAEMGRQGGSMGSLGAKMALAAVTFNADKMEAIGKQMEDAGKPMEATGKKMEAVGKKMEGVQKEAERTARGVIAESLRNGTAKPVATRE